MGTSKLEPNLKPGVPSRAEQQHQDTSRKLDLVLNSLDIGLWEWNIRSNQVSWSSNIGPLFGLERGRHPDGAEGFLQLIHPEDRERVRGSIEACLGGGHPVVSDYRILHPDGTVRWLEDNAAVLRDDGGMPVSLTGVIRDVTHRKESEQQLRNTQGMFRQIFETIPASMGLSDLETEIIVEANPAMERVLGYSRDEMVGRTAIELGIVVDVEKRTRMRKRIRRGSRAAAEVMRFRRKNGEIGTWEVKFGGLIDVGGRSCILSIGNDITDRVRTEDALAHSEERYRRLFESSTDGIVVANSERFEECNERTLEMFGYSREEMIGLTPWEVSPPLQPDGTSSEERARRVIQAAFDQGPQRFDWVHRRADGSDFDVEATVNVVRSGPQPMILATLRDISERAQAERELRQAYRENQRLRDQLQAENIYLREELTQERGREILGTSDALRNTLEKINLVTATDSTVVIQGDSGTGKELVAREIHRRSLRSERMLVTVNCASIPNELYESEFFGHVKGAFTGAVKNRAGRFELADGGTIFLDEVGEIPLAMQAKLLRVLQEGQFERVGDEVTQTVDVRVIVATNKSLKQEVDAGRFRQDLYYRLNVFPIEIAPLRDRREDIPILAAHFLDDQCRRLRRPVPPLTEAHLRKLQGYDWPGNVRELQNTVERAVISLRDGPLVFDLPSSPADLREPVPVLPLAGSEPAIYTAEEMRERERENLLRVLRRTNWRVFGPGGAAEFLGMKPTTLSSRLKTMGIRKP